MHWSRSSSRIRKSLFTACRPMHCYLTLILIQTNMYYAENKLLLNKLYLHDIYAKSYCEYFVLFKTVGCIGHFFITEEKYFCVYLKYNFLLFTFTSSTFF